MDKYIYMVCTSKINEYFFVTDNLKKVLSLCKHILLEIRSISERVAKIEQNDYHPSEEQNENSVLENLPFKTVDSIEDSDNLMKDAQIKQSLVCILFSFSLCMLCN